MLAKPLAYLLAALLVASIGNGCVTAHQRDKARMEVATLKTTLATERSDAADAARELATLYRKTEQARVDRAKEIADGLAKANAARPAARERERTARDSVRNDVATFLAPVGGGTPETCAADLAAERRRAATLGLLYQEADGQAGEFAAAAEQHADEVRALKRQLEADREVPGAQQ